MARKPWVLLVWIRVKRYKQPHGTSTRKISPSRMVYLFCLWEPEPLTPTPDGAFPVVLHISPSSGPLHDCLPGAFRDNLEPSPSTFADSGCGLRPVVLQPSPQGAAFHYLRGACLQCSGSRRCCQNVRLDLSIICFVCRSVALWS